MTCQKMREMFVAHSLLESGVSYVIRGINGPTPEDELIVGLGSQDGIHHYMPVPVMQDFSYYLSVERDSFALWVPNDMPWQLSVVKASVEEISACKQLIAELPGPPPKEDGITFLPLAENLLRYFSSPPQHYELAKELGLQPGGPFTEACPASLGRVFEPIPSTHTLNADPKFRICLVAHLRSPVTASEVLAFLGVSHNDYAKIITVDHDFPLSDKEVAGNIAHAKVTRTPAGLDHVAAFAELLCMGAFDDYDLICKVHDFHFLHNGFETALGKMWRRKSLWELLGSTETVEAIIGRFKQIPNLGMIIPQGLRFPAYSLLATESAFHDDVLQLAERIGLHKSEVRLEYGGGAMFWCRTRALQRIRDCNLSTEDFLVGSSKPLQTAAVERAFGMAVAAERFVLSDTAGPSQWHSTPVASTKTRLIKESTLDRNRETCIFVTFARGGRIQDDIWHYCRSLRAASFQLILTIVASNNALAVEGVRSDDADIVLVRANEGHDFAAVAATMELYPDCLGATGLLITNDSVIGPLSDFNPLMHKVRTTQVDFVGLVESWQYQQHYQSWFLYFKASALRAPVFRKFWANVRNLPTRETVISNYEVPMYSKLTGGGLRGGAIFESDKAVDGNPTLHHWRELLARGLPFIKRSLLGSQEVEAASVAERFRQELTESPRAP